MRRTTIKDVAALAGVSPATVSRTLDDRPEISAETKERVRAACAQLGYVPNAAAINEAVEEAKEQGIHGKATTPFLLAKIKDITGGSSLDANIQLVYNNAKLAAATACELAKLAK